MTDSFVTQCPHCQTSFRVTHHQLSVARGVVRCGHCLQVFNAAKQLLEQNRASAPEVPVPAPVPAAPAEPVVEPPVTPEPVTRERSITPDEDWALTAQALDARGVQHQVLAAPPERRGRRRHPDDAQRARDACREAEQERDRAGAARDEVRAELTALEP